MTSLTYSFHRGHEITEGDGVWKVRGPVVTDELPFEFYPDLNAVEQYIDDQINHYHITGVLKVPEAVSFAVGGLKVEAYIPDDMATAIVVKFSLRGTANVAGLLSHTQKLLSKWVKDAGALPNILWENFTYDFSADYTTQSLPLHIIVYTLSLKGANTRRAVIDAIRRNAK